ncbi:hypothetical protein NMD1_01701 [Novosphingobium sp. MD-1]|nr:hypothetical protein NMD1_01701 [Novosphingobium sp. MD-1]
MRHHHSASSAIIAAPANCQCDVISLPSREAGSEERAEWVR